MAAKLVKLRARWVVKTNDGYVKPGETFELDAAAAKNLVDRGAAEYVKEPPKGEAAKKGTGAVTGKTGGSSAPDG